MRVAALVAAAVCAMPHGAEAQSRLGPERRDINDVAGDIWSVWTSPVHPDRRAALPMLGAASAIAGVGVFADSAVYAWMTTHPTAFVVRELSPLRERKRLPFYELGSGQVLLPLSGVLYAAGRLSHDASLRDAGLGCAAGHLSSAGLRDVVAGSMMGFAIGKALADRQEHRNTARAATIASVSSFRVPILSWSFSF